MKKLNLLIALIFILGGCAVHEVRPAGTSNLRYSIEINDCVKRAGGAIISLTPTGKKIYRECMESKGYIFEDVR